ncbi:GUN4 domain-containing protein [Calothrix membranacea FACHB-236]|nr:GUN4 domain-containing protein [Calothrix membranacea FACHB-236]
MKRNCALVIGVNQYKFLQPLKYAKRDAKLIRDFFVNEKGFDQVFLFSDDSSKLYNNSNFPLHTKLLHFLQQSFEKPFLEPGAHLWVFFIGHGIVHENQDYLMLYDGNPQDVENTTISINYLTQRLLRCGTDNIILILDASRHQNKNISEKFGRHTQHIAVQNGVTTIFSCNQNEYSYEIDALQQGVFTYALLESLGNQGQCATLERLEQYLSFRVPQLVSHYKYPLQTPKIVTNSKAKSNLIIFPEYATLDDINKLKMSALQAEVTKKLELAEQVRLQVQAIESTTDIDTIEAINTTSHLTVEFVHSQNHTAPLPTAEGRNSELSFLMPTLDLTNANIYRHELNNATETYLTLNNVLGCNLNYKNFQNNNIDNLKDNYINICPDLEIHYQRLQELLAGSKWKEADRETLTLLLKVADREKQGWLNIQSINKLSCIHLHIIDQLWLQHSNGRFGLSIQKRIWESLKGQFNADYEIWCQFCDRLGWRVNNNWLFYSDLTFDLNAPQGHFPAASLIYNLTAWKGWVVGSFSCIVGFSALINKY